MYITVCRPSFHMQSEWWMVDKRHLAPHCGLCHWPPDGTRCLCNHNLEFVRFEISLFIAFWLVRARYSFNFPTSVVLQGCFCLFCIWTSFTPHRSIIRLACFCAQAVCQNLVNLYWRRGDGRLSIGWRRLAGGKVCIRLVILSIVVNNKIYVI